MADVCFKYLVFFVFGLLLQISLEEEERKCLNGHQCIRLSQCQATDPDVLIYPCHRGLNMVCCPSGLYLSNNTALVNRKTSLFPVDCGAVSTADKISGGKKADLGQFPWMALLGYRQKRVDYTQFLCGGSIITEHYILTAAHCINLDRRLELVVVRLGEHDLINKTDCIEIHGTRVCADKPIDSIIEQVLIHPDYRSDKLQYDIALIRVKQRIRFTDYVRPICLPFEKGLENKNLSKQKFTVSGWGKTNAANIGGSTSLQYTRVTVWNDTACRKSVPPDVKPIQSHQLCANGASKEDACKGDSGGPMVNATVDGDGELRYFQIGIVSFASSLTCGDPSLPTVYTRVDKFLDWIEDNVS